MRNLATLALLIGLSVPAAVRADPTPLDLRSDGDLSRALVHAETQHVQGSHPRLGMSKPTNQSYNQVDRFPSL